MKKPDFKKLWIVPLFIIAVGPFYTSPAAAGTLSDNFDGAFINRQLWWAYSTDQHQRCIQQDGGLRIQIDGDSVGDGWFNAGISSKFIFKGDFEIVVDYNLTNWPYSNGVRSGIEYSNINFSQYGHIVRVSFGADEPPTPKETYVTDFMDGSFLDHSQVSTTDNHGSLKLTRVDKVITGYFFQNNAWIKVGSHDYSSTGLDDWLAISVGSHSSWGALNPDGQPVHPFAGLNVETVFDNLQITYDQIRDFWKMGPAPGILQLLLD